MEILKINELTKHYKSKLALDHVTFSVEDGEFLSILGPSGCGNTTLLRLLIGLISPDSGQILLEGKDITHASPDARDMGIVFQNYALFENMTALRNVSYAMKFKPELKSDAEKRAEELLRLVGLSEHINKYPSEMSGGQQQRVAIARAIAQAPPVILADEPTGNLDSGSTQEIMEILKGLHKEKRTVILITHDNEIAARAKRIIRIMDGKIVADIVNDAADE